MINTSTNQPYLTVRDLIEMLSDPSVDKDLKVSFSSEDSYEFIGGFKRKTASRGNGQIKTLELHP